MKFIQKFKYPLLFFVALCVIVVASLLKTDIQTQASTNCIEDDSVVLAKVKARGNTYRLHRISHDDGHDHPNVKELLIVTNSDGICSVLNDEPGDKVYPLNSYTSDEISTELNRQRWEALFQQVGGREKFESGFKQYAKGEGELFMLSDAYNSMEAMGIEVPENVVSVEEIEVSPEVPLEKH